MLVCPLCWEHVLMVGLLTPGKMETTSQLYKYKMQIEGGEPNSPKLLPGSAETTPKKMAPNSHVTDARTAGSNEAHRSNSQVPEDACSESEGSD